MKEVHTLEHVNPPGNRTPGLSQAVRVTSRQMAFLSAHVPYAASGALAESFEGQCKQVFVNLGATLSAIGSSFDDVARITVYILDYTPEMLVPFRSVRDRFINTVTPPASALVGVSALFQAGVMIEIDAIAVIPDPT